MILDRYLLPGQKWERSGRAYWRGPMAGCRQESVACGESPSRTRPREDRVEEGTGRGIGKVVSWPGHGGPEQNRPQHNQERRAQGAARLHIVATILCTPAKGITTRPDMWSCFSSMGTRHPLVLDDGVWGGYGQYPSHVVHYQPFQCSLPVCPLWSACGKSCVKKNVISSRQKFSK